MKRIALSYIVLFSLLIGCQPDKDVFDGPSLINRFGEFQLLDSLSVSEPEVDFSTGETVFFSADFSKSIAWVLRITGQNSGAVKLIEGFDSELNLDNATWNGTTTSLPFFNAEPCVAELIIPEEDSLTVSVPLTVTGRRTYEGNLVTGFETDLGSGFFLGDFEFEFEGQTGIRSDIPAGEGDRFFYLEGTDDVVANFFVGLMRIFPSVNGNTYFNLPTTVPDNAYFNFMLYGENTPNTIAVVQLFTDANGNGTFEEGGDQSFQLEGDFPVNFSGWQLKSFTLGEIGMNEQQASEIVAIQVLLISNLNGQPSPPLPVKYGIDYLTFTSGEPLMP